MMFYVGNKRCCIVYVKTYSVAQSTIGVRNKLSTDYVHVCSVNKFENKIHTCLMRASYTLNSTCGL